MLMGILGVWLGFVVARQLDWPEGAAIVLVLAAQFGLGAASKRLRE
jgi:hypothetical protein